MKTPGLSETIQLAAAIGTILGWATSERFRTLLQHPVTIPLWAALALIVVLAVVRRTQATTAKRAASVATVDAVTVHETPRLVIASAPQSFTAVGSGVFSEQRGTFATWVHLDEPGRGIRELGNNRYVFATAGHATDPYRSVIAVARGPKTYSPPKDPSWKLWLCDDHGVGREWTHPDAGEFGTGWHLLTLRWDHTRQHLELLINNRRVFALSDYLPFWPHSLSDRVLVGAWPNGAPIHYVNTTVWRTHLLPVCVGDEWIGDELRRQPPAHSTKAPSASPA